MDKLWHLLISNTAETWMIYNYTQYKSHKHSIFTDLIKI